MFLSKRPIPSRRLKPVKMFRPITYMMSFVIKRILLNVSFLSNV